MINSIFNTALYGMSKASVRFNTAASDLVNKTAPTDITANYEAKAKSSEETRQTEIQSSIDYPQTIVDNNSSFPTNSIAADVVNMKIAKTAYAASAKLYKTADEMAKTILDI